MMKSGQARLSIEGLQSDLAGPFSLNVETGRCAVVTGASGSGKSLLLRMIADLDPNRGVVRLDDRERDGFKPQDWRKSVVYVAAEAGWWAQGVAEHFAAAQVGPAQGMAKKLGLEPDLLNAEVARLSTGEKQRLALIRALLLESPVLLLDEPTGALDQASVALVEALIRDRMAKGVAVVMVTHDDLLAQRLGDQHYRMSQRRLSPA